MGWVGNVEQGEWGRWGGGKVLGEDKKTGGCEGRQSRDSRRAQDGRKQPGFGGAALVLLSVR